MEFQPIENISAQLFNKQLPFDANANYTGCDSRVYPGQQYMTTCVDPFTSDSKIETAFQNQLNLSEYYKSPEVFETVKRNFMDETGDYVKTPPPQNGKVPGYSKERFGKKKESESESDDNTIYYILFIALILILLK
jgi:hypothetical protein